MYMLTLHHASENDNVSYPLLLPPLPPPHQTGKSRGERYEFQRWCGRSEHAGSWIHCQGRVGRLPPAQKDMNVVQSVEIAMRCMQEAGGACIPTQKAKELLWWSFLKCKDLERMFDKSFPACTFLYVFFMEISSHTLIPLFRPGSIHSDSATWDNCNRVFPDELHVSSFPEGFQHYVWTVA